MTIEGRPMLFGIVGFFIEPSLVMDKEYVITTPMNPGREYVVSPFPPNKDAHQLRIYPPIKIPHPKKNNHMVRKGNFDRHEINNAGFVIKEDSKNIVTRAYRSIVTRHVRFVDNSHRSRRAKLR